MRRFLPCDNDLPARAIPRRNAMSPPQLPRDGPVMDVSHPVEINLAIVGGREADVVFLYDFNRTVGERLDFHKPLSREPRLNHGSAAIAFADCERVILLTN